MTRPDFDAQIVRLMVLRFPPADVDEHFKALQDIPAEVFLAAVSHALKTRRDFPVPSELRVDADLVKPSVVQVPEEERTAPIAEPYVIEDECLGVRLRLPISAEYFYDCDTCSDTGWESLWCGHATVRRAPWMEFRNCDRRGAHGSHEWVRHCGCWETNPTLVRKRAAMQKYSNSSKVA